MAGVRNTLGDLNNHLFEQLERLNDEKLTGEDLKEEIVRAKAVTGLASQIIANGTLVLKGIQLRAEYGIEDDGDKDNKEKKMPRMLKADFLRE